MRAAEQKDTKQRTAALRATRQPFPNRSFRESAAREKRRGPLPHQLLAFLAGMLAALVRAASQKSQLL